MVYQQPWLKIAATFLLLCISSYLVYQSFFRSDIYNIQSGGKSMHAVLPDGSEVWLNAESRLTYHKGFVKDREVTLEGEAFFDVEKDREHTFTIRANDVVVQVLGTSFNVRAYQSEILTEVFVVTGKVSVKTDDENQNIVLLPGMTGVLSHNNHQLSINTEADANRLAWKNKELVFKKTPLRNVVKTLSFYFKKDFTIRNKELNNCRFTGSFKDPSLDEVLESLRLALDLDLKIDPQQNSYTLDGVGCKDNLE
jgi:ferric-dicitrate binding protein FerR (iron transport regulator)